MLVVVFQIPDVVGQSGLVPVLSVVEVRFMTPIPLFECVPSHPSVCFNTPRSSFCYCGPVYNAVSLALALHRTDCNTTLAVAAWLWDNLLGVIFQNFHVVSGH